MNNPTARSFFRQYIKYLPYGVLALLTVWLVALLTVTFLPGPYRFDFFGVVAERTKDTSSASLESIAIITALAILPITMALVERYKKHS